jgi:hypothetical protein
MGEAVQGLVEGDDLICGQRQRHLYRIEIHPLQGPAVFEPLLAPGRLDEDAPHRLRGHGDEVVLVGEPV